MHPRGPWIVRSEDHSVEDYPYCAIGKIKYATKQGIKQGTGFLIGPNIVLTVAHNCFDSFNEVNHENIVFIPAPLQDRT